MPCSRANNRLAIFIPGQCPLEKLLDPGVAEYSVTEGTEEVFRSICRLLFKGVVRNKHGSNIGKLVCKWQDKEYS